MHEYQIILYCYRLGEMPVLELPLPIEIPEEDQGLMDIMCDKGEQRRVYIENGFATLHV